MPSRRPALATGAVLAALLVGEVSAYGGAAPSAADRGRFGSGRPGFVLSVPPASFSARDFAGEPSVGVDWRTGGILVMASTATYRVRFDPRTSPPRAQWTDVSSPYSVANVDPILATDPRTGLTLAGGDDGGCAAMSRTTDDGGSGPDDPTAWVPSAPCPFTADHPTVGFAPGSPLAAAGGEVAYFCQQSVVDACSRSLDGGLTWQPAVPLSDCVQQFGHIKASPDGTTYLPSRNCTHLGRLDSDFGVDVTTDFGTTWRLSTIPEAGASTRGFDPSIGTTTDNAVYEAWERGGDFHPMVAWSHDHAHTWSAPLDLARTVHPALAAASFAAVVGGSPGRAAVAYLGTWKSTQGLSPYDNGYRGVWYLFVSFTWDGGRHWTTVRATPTPVQRGQIDDAGIGSTGQRNLLDFIDAAATKDGRVVVAFADGCTSWCDKPNGTVASSTDALATVAYQSAGRGLFARADR